MRLTRGIGLPLVLVLGAVAMAIVAGPAALAAQPDRTIPASRPIQLVLPLAADEAGLGRLAQAITTPGSPHYAQYESIAELAGRFGASASTRRRVLAYLRGAGASDVRLDATGLFADATVGAGLAQRLFSTPLAQFHTASAGSFIAPTGAVSVPRALRGLVSGVVGLDTRPLFSPPPQPPAAVGAVAAVAARSQAHAAAAQPSSAYLRATGKAGGCRAARRTHAFTPRQYLTAYGYDRLHRARLDGQGQRVALIEIDGFKDRDIRSFAHCFGLRLPKIQAFGVGVRRPLAPGRESTLDLEVLDAAAPRLRAIDVYEIHANAATALRALTAPLQNRGFKPQVMSVSLILCEPFAYLSAGRSGLVASEGALAEAAASGVTVLAASGDSGSASCLARGRPLDRLAVNYPASSPSVTGVGGTNVALSSANRIRAQVVWNDAAAIPGSAGGGGSSRLFSRPRYQAASVAANVRAVPDVSMLSDILPGYAFYCTVRRACINRRHKHGWGAIGGTSAATPLLAGGFALVDQELRRHRRQALGLANPLLYGAAGFGVFYDVRAIGNDVGPFISRNHRPLGCCAAGPGYDEASGLGSVDLTRFAAVALAVEPKIVSVGLSLPRHQRPLRHREILATVSCSGPCVVRAVARIEIGRSRPMRFSSKLHSLPSGGRETIGIGLSRRELRRLRAALRRHERIVAEVVGETVDASRHVERRSRARRLRIA